MTVGERAQRARRWITTRTPRSYLLVGWLVFMLGAYPGYLTVDATLQLYTVRSGDYTDYAPVMTALWGALEYVSAGPFPMLALQSGLFLFGLYATLSKLLSPRAAALTTAGLLLFPPVFAPMAVIWPESLMAGALLATTGALLDGRRGWRIAAGVFAVIACSCRFECVFALTPIAFFALPAAKQRWKRGVFALGLVVGTFAIAKLADTALTVTETYAWNQQLQVMDTVGTLRRAKVKDNAKQRAALAGLPLADPATLTERMNQYNDALDWYPLSYGSRRVLELVDTEDEARALGTAWRSAISAHPSAYVFHRWAVTRTLLGITGKWAPVYDGYGDVDLLAPLHHRATASDWQYGMQRFVRAIAATPLMKPWLYLALAVVALWLARKRQLLRNLVVSGLVLEVTMFVFAPTGAYRYSHWFVTTTCIALVALTVVRRWPAPVEEPS